MIESGDGAKKSPEQLAEQERLKNLTFKDFDDGIYITDEKGEKVQKISAETHPAEYQEWENRITSALGFGTKAERDAALAEARRLPDHIIKKTQDALMDQVRDKVFEDEKVKENLIEKIKDLKTDDDSLAIGRDLMKIPDSPESIQRQGRREHVPQRSSAVEKAQRRMIDGLNERYEKLKQEKKPMSAEERDAFEERIGAAENINELNTIFNELRRYPHKTAEEILRAQDRAEAKQSAQPLRATPPDEEKKNTVAPVEKKIEGLTEAERQELARFRALSPEELFKVTPEQQRHIEALVKKARGGAAVSAEGETRPSGVADAVKGERSRRPERREERRKRKEAKSAEKLAEEEAAARAKGPGISYDAPVGRKTVERLADGTIKVGGQDVSTSLQPPQTFEETPAEAWESTATQPKAELEEKVSRFRRGRLRGGRRITREAVRPQEDGLTGLERDENGEGVHDAAAPLLEPPTGEPPPVSVEEGIRQAREALRDTEEAARKSRESNVVIHGSSESGEGAERVYNVDYSVGGERKRESFNADEVDAFRQALGEAVSGKEAMEGFVRRNLGLPPLEIGGTEHAKADKALTPHISVEHARILREDAQRRRAKAERSVFRRVLDAVKGEDKQLGPLDFFFTKRRDSESFVATPRPEVVEGLRQHPDTNTPLGMYWRATADAEAIQQREIYEREYTRFFDDVNWERVPRNMVIATAIAIPISVGVTAYFALAPVTIVGSLAAAATGALSKTAIQEFLKRNNARGQFIAPWFMAMLTGGLVGFGTKLGASQVEQLFTGPSKISAVPPVDQPTVKAPKTFTPQPDAVQPQPPVQPRIISPESVTPPPTPPAPTEVTPQGFRLRPEYTVGSNDIVGRTGLDGYIKTQILNAPSFRGLSGVARDQFIEAARAVLTDPQFAERFGGRIIRGADGLDLAFGQGDVINGRFMGNRQFLSELANELRSGRYRVLENAMSGRGGIRSIITQLSNMAR